MIYGRYAVASLIALCKRPTERKATERSRTEQNVRRSETSILEWPAQPFIIARRRLGLLVGYREIEFDDAPPVQRALDAGPGPALSISYRLT